MIPDGWEVKTIKDIIYHFQNGNAFSSKNYTENGIPIISLVNIGLDGKFKINLDKVKYWKKENFDELKNFHVFKGDLLIAMTDVTPDKNLIGIMALVNEDGPFLLNQRVGLLRVNAKKISSAFLSHFGNSLYWKKYCKSVSALGAQANISTPAILKGKILIPPLPEQDKITEVLGSVDSVIDITKAVITQTQKLKHGFLQTLLTKGIGHTKFKDSMLGEIPSEWKVKQFGKICALSKRKYDPKTSSREARCVELEHIQQNTGNLIGETSAQGLSSIKTVFRSGDVLFGKLRPYLRKYHLASFDGVCTTEIWVLTPSTEMLSEYLYLIVQSDYFIKAANVSTGTKMPRAEWSIISELEVAVPNLEEQKNITTFFMGLDNELQSESEKLKVLLELKKGLLQDLLTGKVRTNV